MAAAIGLRNYYDPGALRAAAKRSKDGLQARRLLALAAIYDLERRTNPCGLCSMPVVHCMRRSSRAVPLS